MTHGVEHPDSKRDEIVQKMREGIPFIALCAEACGINRTLCQKWLYLGRSGDPRYAKFYEQIYQIRADYALKLTKELTVGGEGTALDREVLKQKQWILTKMDRETFDPPKEMYEKTSRRPELIAEATVVPTPNALGIAQNILSLPPKTQE